MICVTRPTAHDEETAYCILRNAMHMGESRSYGLVRSVRSLSPPQSCKSRGRAVSACSQALRTRPAAPASQPWRKRLLMSR